MFINGKPLNLLVMLSIIMDWSLSLSYVSNEFCMFSTCFHLILCLLHLKCKWKTLFITVLHFCINKNDSLFVFHVTLLMISEQECSCLVWYSASILNFFYWNTANVAALLNAKPCEWWNSNNQVYLPNITAVYITKYSNDMVNFKMTCLSFSVIKQKYIKLQ